MYFNHLSSCDYEATNKNTAHSGSSRQVRSIPIALSLINHLQGATLAAQTTTIPSLKGCVSIPKARWKKPSYALQLTVNEKNPIRLSSSCIFHEQDNIEVKYAKKYENSRTYLIKMNICRGLRPQKCEFTPPC